MALSCVSLQVNSSGLWPFVPGNADQLKSSLSSTFKIFPRKIKNISKTMLQDTSRRLLDAFVDSTFQFVDQPYPPSHSNMTPVEGIGEEVDPLAIIMSSTLNMLRHGAVSKHYQNISIVHHSGKLYTASDNCLAQEINIHTLESLDDWDMNGAWDHPFSGHPKKAPSSGELVTMGVDGQKPYWVVGVVSGSSLYFLRL